MRRYGVEFEFIAPWNVGRQRIMEALTAAGIAVSNGYPAHADHWQVKGDGSVRGRGGQGMEIASAVLRGSQGFRDIGTVCSVLRGLGCTVNRTCGLHVHHDANDLSLDAIKRVVRLWANNQVHINGLVASGRPTNRYCSALHQGDIGTVDSLTALNQLSRVYRYKALNVAAYMTHGTLEVRLHQGTLETDKVLAWVMFTKAMVRAAVEGATDARADLATLLTDLDFAPGSAEHQWFMGRRAQLHRGQVQRTRRSTAAYAASYGYAAAR